MIYVDITGKLTTDAENAIGAEAETEEEITIGSLIDHEERICLLEMGLNYDL